jgi:hypothetical protein
MWAAGPLESDSLSSRAVPRKHTRERPRRQSLVLAAICPFDDSNSTKIE